jgi:NADP-dependent 3-hydroxy acid dehydrogenase YdfG
VGYAVYGTARRVDSAATAELAGQGIRTLPLDVTDEASMQAAVRTVEEEHGAVGALVNSAGVGLAGTVEEADLDSVRTELFEVNVFGMARLTQLVLPGMRARRSGTVVNISSIFGRFASAGGGYYAASKHAVEAISEALRLETAPFGVRVVVIEPATVRTSFASHVLDQPYLASDGTLGDYRGFRADLARWYAEVVRGDRRNIAARRAVPPELVAAVVARAIRSPRPRARYRAGSLARLLLGMRGALPDRLWYGFARTAFPTPAGRAPDPR